MCWWSSTATKTLEACEGWYGYSCKWIKRPQNCGFQQWLLQTAATAWTLCYSILCYAPNIIGGWREARVIGGECPAGSTRNSASTRGEEWFLHSFVLTRWEVVQPVLTKAILQPAKAATMCTAHLEYARPFPSFLLVQPLSSNRLHQLIMYSQSQTTSNGVINT